VTLTCLWKSLFTYAGEAGKARMVYASNPTPENKAAMEAAIKAHDEYRDLCLKADRMI
jgi:hypothetical protein